MSVERDVQFEQRLEAEVQAAARPLKQQVESLTAEANELRELIGFYQSIDGAVVKPPRWTVRAKRRREHRGIAVAQLTDTHFDEVVRPEEIEFINAYNRQIAEIRLRLWAEKVVTLTRDYVTGVEIDGLAVFATGDILSGDIHAELKESNEDHLYSSAVHWVEQLIAALTLLVEEFGKVHVAAVVGNHGRSTRKPVYKGRARSNIEWLLWRVIAGRMANVEGITFTVSDAMDLTVPLYDMNYLLTHGDQFRGGSGISGALAPLMLGQHRKSVRQMSTAAPMDIMVMGHFHQLLTLPGLTVGGSMKGTDEFAYGINVRPEPAQQAYWITTPERGPTVRMPIHLQNRKAEGW